MYPPMVPPVMRRGLSVPSAMVWGEMFRGEVVGVIQYTPLLGVTVKRSPAVRSWVAPLK